MKRTLIIAALLSVSVIAGCKPDRDPAKWYLTGYESGKLVIQHDHKTYTAVCDMYSRKGSGVGFEGMSDCNEALSLFSVGDTLTGSSKATFSDYHTGGAFVHLGAEELDIQSVWFHYISITEER
jgi:hypothetical protein